MRVARTNAKSDTPGIVSTRALIRRCAVALAQHLGRNCHFPRHSPKAMCGNMCGLPQHAVLGSQHSGAAGAVIVAALNSPQGKKKKMGSFFSSSPYGQKKIGALFCLRVRRRKKIGSRFCLRVRRRKKSGALFCLRVRRRNKIGLLFCLRRSRIKQIGALLCLRRRRTLFLATFFFIWFAGVLLFLHYFCDRSVRLSSCLDTVVNYTRT